MTAEGTPGSNAVAAGNNFALYQSTTDYLVPNYFEVGGGNIFSENTFHVSGQFPILHFSLHKPHFAVVNICAVDQEALLVPFGEPPPTPVCDKTKPINSVVFERDLGSVRAPPFVALVTSSILFALTLLSLHWRERDLQEQAAAEQAEADAKAGTAVERIPEKV